MTTTVYVEGDTDKSLLEILLEDLRQTRNFNIIACGSRDAARPIARKQLIGTHQPVALVVDADTTDVHRAQSDTRDLLDYLHWGAGSTPFAVMQFVPEIESVFFDCPETLRSLVGHTVDDSWLSVGKNAPKVVLQSLTKHPNSEHWISKLNLSDIDLLRKHPVVAKLREFLEDPFRYKG